MSTPPAPPLTVVQPGEGRAGKFFRGSASSSSCGAPTPAARSRSWSTPSSQATRPPHLHTREDEFSIVTEGEIGFRSGDREVVLGPGGYITKPRGELHSMWNAGDIPARMIEVISPGGFEHFFREMTELAAAGPPPFADVQELGAKYGLEFGEPEWLPDIIGRYGLTPPPRRES